MKVLQIYKDYYPPVKGGIEGHINLLARGLKENGLEVQVLVSNTRNRLQKERIDGIKITKVPQLGRLSSAPINPSLHLWLHKLGQDADILHFHFPNPTAVMAYLLGRGLSAKLVVTYHSDIVRQKYLGRVFSPFMNLFLAKTDRILATSPNYIQQSKVLSGLKDKCVIIPLGIDVHRFDLASEHKNKLMNIQSRYNRPLILFVGRFRYYKGLHILIDAMQNVDADLLLIGAGPLEEQLQRQVTQTNLQNRVHFMGELSDEQVSLYLNCCDLFVLPSVFKSEAFGIVQLEAMACGKPVICSELGTGTSFVNQHRKTGLVVRPEDPEALSAGINSLLSDRDLRTEMGRAGRRRVIKHFTADMMIKDTIDLYRNLVSP